MVKFSLCLIVFVVTSCVSQAEHDRILSEKNSVEQERDRLKSELEEIKFGAPNLLEDGRKFYEAQDYSTARQKFQMLLNKHPELPQAIEAKRFLSVLDEEEAWSRANSINEISFVEAYIKKYPEGKYKAKAAIRREHLKVLNMEKSYEAASARNTSFVWKEFLENYPDHPEASAIRKRVIRLEVDEILKDARTGEMPAFNQFNFGFSSSSTVKITNSTGCDLIVRYSGPDAKIVSIAPNQTSTVYLKSGNYKIAASACGANYAGTESLSGDYGSTFYIVRSGH